MTKKAELLMCAAIGLSIALFTTFAIKYPVLIYSLKLLKLVFTIAIVLGMLGSIGISIFNFARSKNNLRYKIKVFAIRILVVISIVAPGAMMISVIHYLYGYPNDLYKSGIEKQNKNDVSGALADFNKAIERHPNFTKAYHNRAILKQNRLNDISGALADYNKAIELDSQNAAAYYNRGLLKQDRLEDIPGALADYNKAIELDPQNAAAYYNRGLCQEGNLQDRSAAIKDFRQAASLYRQQGDMSSAGDAIDRLKELGESK
jgi:tetratricopeptide (TPR) repeat protein